MKRNLIAALWLSLGIGASGASLPGVELNLRLAAPISTWDEAVPLGNGAMGVLVWGEGNTLRLSLDRGDLWDERPSPKHVAVRDLFNWRTMQQLVASNRMDEFNRIFDSNYDQDAPPTKLPAGRIEVVLEPAHQAAAFELSLAAAEGLVRFSQGSEARVFVDATSVAAPVALALVPGAPLEVRLKTPESVRKLGYPPPRMGEAGGIRWFEQQTTDGACYAVCVGWQSLGDETLIAAAVATSAEGHPPDALAKTRVLSGLKAGYKTHFTRHARWWTDFWARSSLYVPDPAILRHYYFVRYLSGAASRQGAPPMPLQGVWSADAGTLPPWKGDYHNDLNTQMTYIAYRTSGDFEQGLCFLDFLWDRLSVFQKFARDFYDAPGAAVPGVMSLAGQALGGWGQYSLSPTMGAWNAHLFYLHWRHTDDDAFLRKRAYPFCREIAVCLEALLPPDKDGTLKLPLSSSPEIFDNSRKAFLPPNSNYDLASLKMLFLSLAEMARACGQDAEAGKWQRLAGQLGEFHTTPEGTLLLAPASPLTTSHRHLSNLLPIHPFNLVTVESGDRDRQIIRATLKQWDDLGTRAWCGYSFSWMACLRARVGDSEAALRNLDIFTRAFILRNGFHANGDQTKSGFSDFTYRPFTLEGNFLAQEALHEMLLQSWSAAPGSSGSGIIRVFPAVPSDWRDARFEDLRAEGGHRVSARREDQATTWLRVTAGRGGLVRIRDSFGGRKVTWNNSHVKKSGDNFEVKLKRGQAVEGRVTTGGEAAGHAAPGPVSAVLSKSLSGHWPLDGDARDASSNALHATAHGVNWSTLAGAQFDGRSAWLEVPTSPVLAPGTNDFTIALWLSLDNTLDDSPGDLVTLFDPAARNGFNLTLQHQSATCSSMANTRNLLFGLDAGTEPRWADCGRPGNNLMVYALTVFEGGLYAGTFEHGADESGRVYRYAGETNWVDCGAPDRCNTVSALAVFNGELYAGVTSYSGVGSHLKPSPNTHPGGRIYRYAGGKRWMDCGRLCDAEVVWGLTVFQGKLHATVMDLPPKHLTTPRQGLYRYEGGTNWTWCGNPGGRVAAITAANGRLFGSGYNGGSLGGVFRYDGGTNWTNFGAPPRVDQTYSFAFHRGRMHTGTWSEGKVFCYYGPNQWEDAGRLGDELEVMGLTVFNGMLYGGTLPLAQVYRKDPGGWTLTGRLDFSDVEYRRAWSMAVYGGRLYCGTLPSGHVHALEAGAAVSHDTELAPGWRHVAAVREGSRLRLCVDGKPVAESIPDLAGSIRKAGMSRQNSRARGTLAPTSTLAPASALAPAPMLLAPNAPLKIGFGEHDYFHGTMRDVRFYGRALSNREVQRLVRETKR